MVETDSKNVIRYIIEDTEEGHPFLEEFSQCKKLLHMPWTCQVKFVPRQANQVADCLAKLGQNFGDQCVIFVDEASRGCFFVLVCFVSGLWPSLGPKKKKTKQILLKPIQIFTFYLSNVTPFHSLVSPHNLHERLRFID